MQRDNKRATRANKRTVDRREQDARRMALVSGKENSRGKREKVRRVADEEPIVGVPAIAVVEPVDVRVPLAPVAIDVADRDASCAAPSVTQANATTSRVLSRLNLIWGR